MKIFNDPEHAAIRGDIIMIWRAMEYREAVPVLVDLLEKQDQFWAKQDLEKDWWNKNVGSDRNSQLRDMYGEVHYTVCTLAALKDRRAREVLKATRNRWLSPLLNNDNPTDC